MRKYSYFWLVVAIVLCLFFTYGPVKAGENSCFDNRPGTLLLQTPVPGGALLRFTLSGRSMPYSEALRIRKLEQEILINAIALQEKAMVCSPRGDER